MRTRMNLGLLLFTVLAVMAATMVMGDPTGADLTVGPTSRGTTPSLGNTTAQAGNVTQLDIDQTRVTDIWQGFYGNVSGSVILSDSSGNNFYDWSFTSMEGEIYATRTTVIDWSTAACTATADWEAEETALGITATAVDGINETYKSGGSHPGFTVGVSGSFAQGECRSTQTYNSTGQPGDFWNVLLTVDATKQVYTSIIADNSDGFNDATWDFEILVPTNRTAGGTSLYYFYVELGA